MRARTKLALAFAVLLCAMLSVATFFGWREWRRENARQAFVDAVLDEARSGRSAWPARPMGDESLVTMLLLKVCTFTGTTAEERMSSYNGSRGSVADPPPALVDAIAFDSGALAHFEDWKWQFTPRPIPDTLARERAREALRGVRTPRARSLPLRGGVVAGPW